MSKRSWWGHESSLIRSNNSLAAALKEKRIIHWWLYCRSQPPSSSFASSPCSGWARRTWNESEATDENFSDDLSPVMNQEISTIELFLHILNKRTLMLSNPHVIQTTLFAKIYKSSFVSINGDAKCTLAGDCVCTVIYIRQSIIWKI